MNLPDNTEVTTLRLELGRMTDKANALEAALRKEVAVVIADAIKDAAKSVAENDRLKQDNVRLSAQVVGLQVNAVNDPSLRSAFLKAVHKDYDDIKAEVDRLRVAGDSLVYSLQWCDWGSHIQTMDAVNRWNSAKEGKPSV